MWGKPKQKTPLSEQFVVYVLNQTPHHQAMEAQSGNGQSETPDNQSAGEKSSWLDRYPPEVLEAVLEILRAQSHLKRSATSPSPVHAVRRSRLSRAARRTMRQGKQPRHVPASD